MLSEGRGKERDWSEKQLIAEKRKSQKKKTKMNCKSEAQSFDWEITNFEHSHLKCSRCPDSKLLNIHFSLFFCKMCRTYLGREERLNACVSIC